MGNNSAVRVIIFGGLGEIGRNCAAIEVDGRLIVIDVGIMFPEADMPGVDLVLPDFTYLLENADRVDGIVLTHGHEDHVGGLSFLLRGLSAPIYGSALAVGIASHRVREAGLSDQTHFVEVSDGETVRIGPCDVEFIAVTHSVPSAHAIAFHTPQGVVLHSGDFKIDLAPVDGRRTDLARFGELANTEGIRLLLADSTNAEEHGFTASETDVGVVLREIFMARNDKRIICACFASHLHRIQQIIDAAVASGRKVATLGRSMKNNVDLARRLDILHVPEGSLIDITTIDNYEPSQICVISTGSQGEPLAALSLMASGQSRFIELGDRDVVVISAHPIPGNEWGVGRVIDQLHRHGCEVIHSGNTAVHVSGHARRGELSILHNVCQPEYFVPVHGEYRHLLHHRQLAHAMGVKSGNTLLALDGDIIVLDDKGIRKQGHVPAGYLYVDGADGDVDHGILRDRQVLATEGLVMVVVTVDLEARDIVTAPEIITRGWMAEAAEQLLASEGVETVAAAVRNALRDPATDRDALTKAARRALGRFVGTRMRRKAMIVPVIVGV